MLIEPIAQPRIEAAIIAAQAEFTQDPRGGEAVWIGLRVAASAGWPFGIGYRVVALVSRDAILGDEPPR